MQVVVTRAQLDEHKACPRYATSPNWNGEALVYPDWDQAVDRLLSTPDGIDRLGWLVVHELVPMSRSEFIAARKNAQKKTNNG